MKSSMEVLRTNPFCNVVPVRGEGCRVWDRDGQEYLDLLAGVWCLVLGYRHPRFTAAIKDQLDKLVHISSSFLTGEIREAAERLQSILPSRLNRVTFLSSGSEAVEFALKLAWAYTGKREIVGFERGYYGATTQALALSEAGRVGAGPAVKELRFLSPHCARCPLELSHPDCELACLKLSAARIEAKAEIDGDGIAAILFEPVQAVGGVIVPPSEYVKELASLAKRWEALLIAEEVTTGLGRTGRWFGFERDAIVPDILVLGKALGNGLPVSAVVTTAEIEEVCAGRLKHVQSHQNDPLSGRAASTVIKILSQEGLVERAGRMGEYLLARLQKLQESHPVIREVRGCGLLAALELQEEAAGPGARLHRFLLAKGIILDYQPRSQTIRLFPPYVIGEEEIDLALAVLDEGLSRLGGG